MGSSQHSGNERTPALTPSPNFYYLGHHDVALVQAATLAERVLGLAPIGALIHLRRFGELLLKRVAARWGVYEPTDTAAQLTRALSRKGLPPNVEQLFRTLREVGNDAAHAGAGDLAIWGKGRLRPFEQGV